MNIWHYGFTEMFNNVIDHSGAKAVLISVTKTAAGTTIDIYDNGVGIFKKIQKAMELDDERHSVLELAKGKFTTDPENHSGEGIFFSSRMFDEFVISSGEVYFSHEFDKKEDWILQASSVAGGTLVRMSLSNHTSRTARKVFDKFTSGDDYGFTKTVVPVKLMKYGDDNLISRSQAKRLLARFDRFKVVVLDFSGVASIGQAFADEVFRVFRSKNPEVEIVPINASSEVRRMVSRAEALGSGDA
jgi:anti-sigma regulatory factor (Ser/Thr protein kinase)